MEDLQDRGADFLVAHRIDIDEDGYGGDAIRGVGPQEFANIRLNEIRDQGSIDVDNGTVVGSLSGLRDAQIGESDGGEVKD